MGIEKSHTRKHDKGQLNLGVMLELVVFALMVLVIIQIYDPIVTILFNTLDNSANIMQAGAIKLMFQLLIFIVVALFVVNLINNARSRVREIQ